jgi:steroid 5-alpha reductase family enzyme
MNTLELLIYGQLGASIVMALAWVHALIIKNTSYVDVLWGYGVGVLGFIYLVLADENTDPDRMALLKALTPNLVHSTGYLSTQKMPR